ncbi:MAG TPA: UDP-4-amino-4,6-dideoxy-N-acetyl-beta-L-altrosamine transaminase [Candidatus Omnitrophica bacterium]|nr:UDP-4-amino-4,6-dideoxy-N-acetyl-beta-L-altrosamine transaminase [Candidatus Omnitrophota bacterium]
MKQIPYGRQSIDKDDVKEVVKVLKSDWLTQGPMVRRFEEALTKYCGAKYAVAVSSGTAALHLACIAAGLKKGDEAITSPITFLATPNAVLYTGAKPVFADIDYDTVNISPGEIEKNITKKTKAILPVHFAGLPCDMPGIAKIARKHNLIIIEDACHALGAEYKVSGKWTKVGSCKHSDMTIFSFHPVKSIATGEGGAITTNNKELYERLIILRNHGVTKDNARFTNFYSSIFPKETWYYEMQYLGFNYRITDMQSALGISQLKRIDIFLKRRREIASIYNRQISKIDEIEAPFEENNVRSAWHLYVIRIRKNRGLKSDRNKLFSYLRKAGIGVQLHYIPIYLQPYYYKLGYKKGICPQAEEYYQTALSLPIYPMLANKDIKYITTKISKFFC